MPLFLGLPLRVRLVRPRQRSPLCSPLPVLAPPLALLASPLPALPQLAFLQLAFLQLALSLLPAPGLLHPCLSGSALVRPLLFRRPSFVAPLSAALAPLARFARRSWPAFGDRCRPVVRLPRLRGRRFRRSPRRFVSPVRRFGRPSSRFRPRRLFGARFAAPHERSPHHCGFFCFRLSPPRVAN